MNGPESKPLKAENLKQADDGQYETELDRPVSEEELENIAGGMQGLRPAFDPSQLRKDPPESEGSGLPKPLKAKGIMGN